MDEPCCFITENDKLVLPTNHCESFVEERFNPVIRLRLKLWDDYKIDFFKTHHITKEELKEYLTYYPKDRVFITNN